MKLEILPIQQLIDNNIAENNKRENKERTGWYASELGYCPRQLFFKRLGVEPDEPIDSRTMRVFEVGKRDESFLLDDIVKYTDKQIEGFNKKILKAEREVRVEDKDLRVSGRVDLLLEYDDKEMEVIETKSKNSRAFWYMNDRGEGANEHHIWQLWFYLYVLKIQQGQIVYVSKDDLSILQYPIMLDDEGIGDKVLARIKYLNEAWDKQECPPKLDKSNWECKYCSYKATCKKNK
jgi:CRISPR-associated protein Cas4